MPPAAVVRLVSTLTSVTGFAADSCQNVIHVGAPNPITDTELTNLCEAFRDFYNNVATGAVEDLGNYISPSVSRAASACKIEAYFSADLDGSSPFGSPLKTLSFTLSDSGGGSPLPEEVAIVASFNGDLTDVPVSETNPTPPPATIRPASRRRGRLYFGPLNSTTLASVSGEPRPTSNVISDLADAMVQLAVDIAAVGNFYLGVWSQLDADVYEVVEGHIDDAWDTQRRRGNAPNVRTPFTIP